MTGPLVKALLMLALLMFVCPATVDCQGAEPQSGQQESSKQVDSARALAVQDLTAFDRELRQVVAVDKTSTEKRWSSQFLFAAPSGGTGTLNFNRTLYKTDPSKSNLLSQLNLELGFGKGGGEKADPRFFNAGLNFRKILLGNKRANALNRLRLSQAPELLAATDSKTFRSNIARTINELNTLNRPQFFLNYASLHFETDLKKLKPGPVNNFIFSPSFEIRSRLMPLNNKHCEQSTDEESVDEQCRPGPFFWSYRFVPVGIEIGKNLRNKDNRSLQGDLIARFQGNANFKLFYQSPCRYDTLFAGIMLESDFTDRYLWRRESAFNRNTDRSDLIVTGNQYAMQIDLKFITGLKLPEDLGLLIKPLSHLHLPKLGQQPALTFSYRRGVVPPVFAFNNKFRIGLTFESLDDDNARDIGHIVPHH